ncbi:macrolide ABC transporter ATP-binding protein [Clostridium baratii]|nr:ABC transporter ATP-binding protein [Clostridium baratii]OPF52002.1 macrolide ABC transporter ATP-binding protein [Clostridium baratii]OPF56361.1 macrolide ABC transporter ATP-binding protein [Clostridium baratii]OPF57150.1 macrolide ABC transporter ATP-binding protein [Clostridium baratii]OPF60714.1 macrolide ABC transporter ATP-binding protein [Clostridium baratii]
MSNFVIDVENACKSYVMGDETLKVLNNITLKVPKGQFVAIIGPSGSGKSTFMNFIGCLDKVDSGTYILDGMDVRDLNDNELSEIRNKKIGFIFQQFNLLSKLSALENVELPLIYRGISSSERKKRAIEALKKVGLENRKNHLPTQLSGGQQQRVAIARAIVTDPEILLCDEPTGALDTKTSKEIMELIKDLNKEGRTIVMITHDLNVASQAKRQIRIKDGTLYEGDDI